MRRAPGFLSVALLILLIHASAQAQSSDNPGAQQSESAETKDDSTIFKHSGSSRFWVSGQINMIVQWHPSFRAKYTGDHSLQPQGENATSRVITLNTGLQLTKTTEILVDVESAGGRGISDAF